LALGDQQLDRADCLGWGELERVFQRIQPLPRRLPAAVGNPDPQMPSRQERPNGSVRPTSLLTLIESVEDISPVTTARFGASTDACVFA